MVEDLNALIAEGRQAQPGPSPVAVPQPKSGIAKVRYTHDALIDMIVANPWISQDALASYFGYSASWISKIVSSDAFQAKLHERKAQLIDPALKEQIDQGFDIMIRRSQEILLARLQNPDVPDNVALRTLDLASRSRGYGARQEPQAPSVDVHLHLESMKENLVGLLRRERGVTIEAAPVEAPK